MLSLGMAFFSKDYLDFFIELAPNNNKDWFDLNRKRYETSVKKPFSAFVQHMIRYLEKYDARLKDLDPAACIFRINRDIRFAKDKSPYKLFCSAVVAPNGKKSEAVNGIYFEIGPESVNVYGGIYEIDKDNLLLIREGIAAQPEAFKKLINDPFFKEVFGEIRGEKNKLLPADLKAAAENEPLIFNKQWYYLAEFSADEIVSDKLDQLLERCFLAGKPLEDFFNQFIQRS
jgi:uncharacterized protein (TIGR02453 family)